MGSLLRSLAAQNGLVKDENMAAGYDGGCFKTTPSSTESCSCGAVERAEPTERKAVFSLKTPPRAEGAPFLGRYTAEYVSKQHRADRSPPPHLEAWTLNYMHSMRHCVPPL